MFAINIVISIIAAIIVFSLLIFFHELGHFTFAKLFKVKVTEFAIGMGPRLCKFQKGETTYSIRAFPFGGFCAMEGEDEDSTDERAFCNAAVWKRFIITAAGAIVNLIIGFIIIIIMTLPDQLLATTTIDQFKEGAVSSTYGLQSGDRITSINGTAVFVDTDISFNMARDRDGIMDIGVERNGEKLVIEDVQFQTMQVEGMNVPVIDFWVYGEQKTVLSVLKHSFLRTVSIARLVWLSLFDLITGNVGLESVAGPVGTMSVIGEAASNAVSTFSVDNIMVFLNIIALISVNLGVFNLLPIPALDGARLVFLIIEGIRRKPVNPKYEGYVHMAGLAVLLLFMVVVTFSDIRRLITGG